MLLKAISLNQQKYFLLSSYIQLNRVLFTGPKVGLCNVKWILCPLLKTQVQNHLS